MSRQRVTEAYVAQLAERLTPHERAIVADLDRLRVLTSIQLERLHFGGDGTRHTCARRCRRTLARLSDRRIVTLLERRIGGTRAGSSGAVYALDVAGQRLASACGPAGGVRLRRPWTPGSAFLAHALAVGDLYVGLREAERGGSLDVLAFDAEPACWRTFTGLGGARVVLKPDAFVHLGRGAWEELYFVEVDRATQSGPAVARKLATYRRYFQTGREQARFEVFPKVLILTPSEARRDALADVAARQPVDAWPLFQVSPYEHALPIFTGAGR